MNNHLSHNPNTEEPTEPARNQSWLQSGLVIISESTAFIALAAKEWLPSLIDQPTTPPFQHNAIFQDEFKRMARLLVFVIVLSGIIVGSLSLLLENVVTLSVIRFSIKALVLGFVISICYQPFAYIFGVRVIRRSSSPKKALSLRQILFSVIYIFVPWAPIFTFLWVTIPATKGSLLIFMLIVFWVCNMYVIYNFSKAILLITRCSKLRVWSSIISPAVIVIVFILFR